MPFVAAMRVSTNPSGYFRVHLRRGGAAQLRYRIEWTGPGGTVLRSRVARAGRRIRYLPDPPPQPKKPVKRR